MNVYMKNYGIWLGGSLALLFLLGTAGLIPFALSYILPYFMIIVGTILGTVMTHKELGKNIEFGKAVGPVLILIGGMSVLGFIISIARWGTDGMSYFLPMFLYHTFIELVIGISILLATGTWYMFEKAGKPGWAMIVPIYNIVVMLEIAQKPTWWTAIILLVPIVNIVFLIMMLHGISKSFGKDAGFTVGLVLLRQIFFAILGYGDDIYMNGSSPQSNDSVIDDL